MEPSRAVAAIPHQSFLEETKIVSREKIEEKVGGLCNVIQSLHKRFFDDLRGEKFL